MFLLFFVIFGTSVCFERCSFGVDFKDILLGDARPEGYGTGCWRGQLVSEGSKPCVQVIAYPSPEDKSVANFYPECGDVNRKAIAVEGTNGQALASFLKQKMEQGIAYDYAIDEGGLYRLFPEAFFMDSHVSRGHVSSSLLVRVAMVSGHERITDVHVENEYLNRLLGADYIERVIDLEDLVAYEARVHFARKALSSAEEEVQMVRENLGEGYIFFDNYKQKLAQAEMDLRGCEKELHTLIFCYSV
ncbi:hypothetical protein [Candidatus Hepatobacter penaei]|uniref:hypothetical protein n=1 Tax=Candidatus Hepatobacter penaei TaxID=1274402 RepID=UPI0012E0732F|nr:hypothetical protein [Candidatus Hepatobacter penaei]